MRKRIKAINKKEKKIEYKLFFYESNKTVDSNENLVTLFREIIDYCIDTNFFYI